MSIDDLSWKLIISVTIAVMLIVVLTTYLIFSTSSTDVKVVDHVPKIIEIYDEDNVLTGATYNFEPFVLNLKNGSGILSLKLAINIFELKLPPHFNALIPGYRDKIISVVTSYEADELLKNRVRITLKKRLLDELNEIYKNGPEILEINFEEFVIR